MKIEIRKNGRLGANGCCRICNAQQEGYKAQPYIVYHKADNENRGHQEPVCSMECAKALVNKLKGGE